MEITENVIAVKERIAKAAALCGRDPSEIALVAASKMNSADKVKEAVLAGVDACGETGSRSFWRNTGRGPMRALRFIS